MTGGNSDEDGTLLLALLLTLAVPFQAVAYYLGYKEPVVTEPESCSGSYYNIDWRYDGDSKTLYFSENAEEKPRYYPVNPYSASDWQNNSCWAADYPWYDDAHQLYNNAEHVQFDETVTAIIPNQLRGFTKVESVIIPDNVKAIYTGAFSRCSKLTEITLPERLEYLESDAFDSTAYYQDKSHYTDGSLYLGNYFLGNRAGLKDVVIKEGITRFANHAIISELNTLTVAKTVNYIKVFSAWSKPKRFKTVISL